MVIHASFYLRDLMFYFTSPCFHFVFGKTDYSLRSVLALTLSSSGSHRRVEMCSPPNLLSRQASLARIPSQGGGSLLDWLEVGLPPTNTPPELVEKCVSQGLPAPRIATLRGGGGPRTQRP